MEILEKKLIGTFEINLKPIQDERGFFMRSFDEKIFKDVGLRFNWVQENHSRTLKQWTIRGLHFQFPPYTETKLIRCIRGKVLDIFVDLRIGSETFGQWDSIQLSEENKKMVLIPRGFAHGFCTLTDESEVLYKVDNYYSSDHECGIVWNDPDLKIKWPVKDPILSDKDKKNSSLKSFKERYTGIKT